MSSSAQSKFINFHLPLGQIRAEAFSAIEGQFLSEEQRIRFCEWEAASLSPQQQRVEIMRLYQDGLALK